MENYQNTPGRMDNYKNATLIRIRASIVTIRPKFFKLKSQPLDILDHVSKYLSS